MYAYTQKSVKFVCSSRSLRASQSPYLVEKQPKSTPDMLNPPTHLTGGDWYYIPTRTFIVAVWTKYEMLRRFQGVANNVNKRLLCHVALVFTSSSKGCTDCYAVGGSDYVGLYLLLYQVVVAALGVAYNQLAEESCEEKHTAQYHHQDTDMEIRIDAEQH